VTLVAAHRGGARLWAENSLRAFRGALALGVDFLELDVHLSRDGRPVVIHDATLERTTGGRGPVGTRTFAELRELRLRDADGAPTGETVPSLDEVVAVAAPTPVRLLVELKADARRAPYPGLEEAVLAALDRRGMAGRVVLMAFEPETVRRLRALRPEQPTGALHSSRTLARLGSTALREIEGLREAGVAFLGLQHSLVTPEVVAEARAAGLLLGAWTVNEAKAMRRIIGLGVGVLITDRPDLALEIVRRGSS
jgi:glycerophosphoryl diester phosphodiesterase